MNELIEMRITSRFQHTRVWRYISALESTYYEFANKVTCYNHNNGDANMLKYC